MIGLEDRRQFGSSFVSCFESTGAEARADCFECVRLVGLEVFVCVYERRHLLCSHLQGSGQVARVRFGEKFHIVVDNGVSMGGQGHLRRGAEALLLGARPTVMQMLDEQEDGMVCEINKVDWISLSHTKAKICRDKEERLCSNDRACSQWCVR